MIDKEVLLAQKEFLQERLEQINLQKQMIDFLTNRNKENCLMNL